MRQPAPLKGERMETLLIQTIVGNTPTSEDAPSRPDHRTEQHITVDLPDSIRHNSDSNRYLINRNAPIGGQAVKLSDIEADNYDLKMVDDYIAIALCDLEEKDNEKNVSRKSFLEITQLLKTIITGLIEDRRAFRNKVATWAYVRKMQRRERSDAQVTGNRVGEDNVDEDESTHLEIVEYLATLRSVSKLKIKMSKLMLKSLKDVENDKFRSISDAMLSHCLIVERPERVSSHL